MQTFLLKYQKVSTCPSNFNNHSVINFQKSLGVYFKIKKLNKNKLFYEEIKDAPFEESFSIIMYDIYYIFEEQINWVVVLIINFYSIILLGFII